jgi:hypothetical protein
MSAMLEATFQPTLGFPRVMVSVRSRRGALAMRLLTEQAGWLQIMMPWWLRKRIHEPRVTLVDGFAMASETPARATPVCPET